MGNIKLHTKKQHNSDICPVIVLFEPATLNPFSH